MPGTLDEWQGRLEQHFGGLAASRSATRFPIFALEHGLEPAEIQEFSELLHKRLAAGQRLFPHWLLWVVYATEQGYAYDGHEYWFSFEQNTPHWWERATGRQLRSYFEKFQKAYNGVIPSGPWASWFSNIAWPITHAILPRYLQVQFARALYESRHQLARMRMATPADAGKVLASNAWDASSRFSEFLEQEELVGRIVLALLGQAESHEQGPIYPKTLARVVADLENVRRAGEWLKETRRIVSDRLHGVDRRRPGDFGAGPEAARLRAASASQQVNIRPSLMLRRSGSTNWSAVMEIPSFAPVARLNPDLSKFLKTTRCRVAGAGDTWLPAGWLFFDSQKRLMKSWPSSGALMVQFERAHGVLDNILRGECRFSSGPAWLFRIGNDGLAQEITGRMVRPGQEYILLSRNALSTKLAYMSPVAVDCEGVKAVAIAVPEAVSVEDTAELHKLGVQVARNIRVWPAGLCVRNWDGEGHGDWLTTEAPCFGIVHDHAVDEYFIKLDDGHEMRIEGAWAGQAVFVRLQPLPPGRHHLFVRARRIGVFQTPRDLEGRIELKVRDPFPWVPGTTSHAGLAIACDPPDPSLDAFWEGDVSLSVLGPENRKATCSITLTGKDGATVLSEDVGAFDLPISATAWRTRFRRFTSDEARAWKYPEASAGAVAINADELGRYTLRLERVARPVRWIFQAGQHGTRVRLVDDTGEDKDPLAHTATLMRPGSLRTLDSHAALAGVAVTEPGALFFATQGAHQDALVVSSSQNIVGLQGLLVEPERASLDQATADILHGLNLVDLWHEARLAGPLANDRRDHITRRLVEKIYGRLCGERWSELEEAFLGNPDAPRLLQELERGIGGLPGFPVILRRDFINFAQGVNIGVKWFGEVAQRYEVSGDSELSLFALRLASFPFGLKASHGNSLASLLDRIRKAPTLLRGARFVALLSAAEHRDGMSIFLPRWSW